MMMRWYYIPPSMTIKIAALLLSLLSICAAAQNFRNMNFEIESSTDSTKPDMWRVGGEGYEIILDKTIFYDGSRSLRIKQITSGQFAAANQSFSADSIKGNVIQYGGYIKTEDVANGYAGLWLRVDGPNNRMLVLNNMQDQGVTGTTPWKHYQIHIPVDSSAIKIFGGVLLTGSGTAWFDALKMEIINERNLPPPSDEALSYLMEALNIMQKH